MALAPPTRPARTTLRAPARAGRGAFERGAWLLPGLVLALFAVRPLGPVRDPDTFWHLRAGEHLWRTWQFVLVDPFGAGAQRPWVLHEWLPELLAHGVDARFGLAGVAWLLCVGATGVGLAVVVACRRRATPLVTAVVLALAFVALAGSLSPRPQLVTFALVPVVVDAWLRTLEDGRPRWWLVPLTWLWACCHGLWFLGPGIGALAVAGGVLDGRWRGRRAMTLAAVPLLSGLAATVTPVGPRLLLAPLQVADVTPWISEWQPTSWTDMGLWAALGLAAPVAVVVVRRRELRWSVTLLVAAAVYLSFAHARTVAVAGVLLAPLAARALTLLLDDASARGPATRRERVAWLLVPGLALAVVAGLAPRVASAPGVGAPGLDPALRALPAGTVVCTDEVLGGWLEWAHPDLRPTADTRVELRTGERIAAHHAFLAGAPGWTAYPAALGCRAALLDASAGAVPRLAADGWRRLADDGRHVLLGAGP